MLSPRPFSAARVMRVVLVAMAYPGYGEAVGSLRRAARLRGTNGQQKDGVSWRAVESDPDSFDADLGGYAAKVAPTSVEIVARTPSGPSLQSQVARAAAGGPLQDLRDLAKEAGKDAQKVFEKAKEEVTTPLMQTVEVLRVVHCWARPQLIAHVECMEFMIKHCSSESTGQGYCKKFRQYLRRHCKQGSEKACDGAKEMGEDVNDWRRRWAKDRTLGEDIPESGLDANQPSLEGAFPAPAPAPAVAPWSASSPIVSSAPASAPAPAIASDHAPLPFDKKIKNLPLQGYNEQSNDEWGKHADGLTYPSDWRKEWPRTKETPHESYARICKDNPKNAWCEMYMDAKSRP